jgi:hypothetical protein
LDALAMELVYADEGEDLDPRERDAAEAHLEGCARCAAMIERLRGGVRAAAELPLEDPSSLLEARILAAASVAKPAPSWPRRITRAMSTVGGWAMRPQIAMAAVLVIMVGTSVLLLRGGLPTARRTKVTDEGQPVATLEPPALSEGQSQGGAPAVIGGEKKPVDVPKSEAVAKPAEAPAELEAAKELAKNEKQDEASADDLDGKDLAGKKLATKGAAPAQGAGGLPAPTTAGPAAAPPPTPPADLADGTKSEAKADQNAPAKKSAGDATSTPASFDESMTAYKAGRYAESAKGFEAQATANVKPSTSWLYAARSFRASGSCVQAIPRFQKVIAGYPASAEVPWAALEGGQCARSIGDPTTARTLLEKAKTYPATQKQAEAELAAMSAPPAPAKAKAKPPSMMDNGY